MKCFGLLNIHLHTPLRFMQHVNSLTIRKKSSCNFTPWMSGAVAHLYTPLLFIQLLFFKLTNVLELD